MDPLSISVSVLAIIESSFQVIGLLNGVKNGGKDRQKLSSELWALYMTFKDLHDQFPTDFDHDAGVGEAQEFWAAPIRSLAQPEGILSQVKIEMDFLASKLTLKSTKVLPHHGAKILQNLKWPFEKKEADQIVARLGRLSNAVTLHLGRANLLIGKQSLAIGQQTNNDVSNLRDTVSEQISQQRRRRIIAWVSTLDFYQKQEAGHQIAVQGTGSWFFRSQDFQQWLGPDQMEDVLAQESAPLAPMYSPEISAEPSDGALGEVGVLDDTESRAVEEDERQKEEPPLLDSILWCHGIHGAGKTILAAVTVDKIRTFFGKKNVVVLMAFCTFDNPESYTARALIASLLRQMIESRPIVSQSINELYDSHVNRQRESQPTTEELCDALSKELRVCDKTFIVIDALDEIPDQKEREALLDRLQALQGSPSIMITSRPLPVIEALFGPAMDYRYCDGCKKSGMRLYHTCVLCDFDACAECAQKSITCPPESHTPVKQFHCRSVSITAQPEDIENYVISRIQKSESLRRFVAKKEGLRELILEKVKETADGMFLLATGHMDELADQQTINEVKAALEQLPNQVVEMYHQVMRRIERLSPHRQEKVTTFIAYIAYAERPMTVEEIEHAVTVRSDSKDIDEDDTPSAVDLISVCAGIVTLDEIGLVRMSHETASDYVRTNFGGRFPDPQLALAVACLAYIKLQPFECGPCSGPTEREELERRTVRYPFLRYATLFWGRHVRRCNTEQVNDLALQFLQQDALLQSAVQVMWYAEVRDSSNWEAKDNVSALHVASYFGLEHTIPRLIALGAKVDAQDCLGATALMYAVTEEESSIVEILLHSGARADLPSHQGTTALLRATVSGNLGIVSQLLAVENISVNAQSKYDLQGSALSIAASCQYLDILKLLLSRPDLDVNQREAGRMGYTTLMSISCYGYADVAKLLLAHKDTDMELKNIDGSTALILAAMNGRVEVVDVLLEHGASPDAQDDFGGRALLRAIDNDCVGVVRLMLQRQVRYDFRDWKGRNILHGCAINRNALLLRVLLENCQDLDINAQGDGGETPLHDAAATGCMETTRVLLEFGARTDIVDNARQTPVRVAKNVNHQGVLILLKEYRDKEEREKSSGWVEVASVAEVEGEEQTEAGSDAKNPKRVDTFGNDLILPLYSAVSEQPLKVLRARIWPKQRNATGDASLGDEQPDNHSEPYHIDVNEPDPRGGATPLHVAARAGRLTVVALLLEAGANVKARSDYGLTPLHEAGWARRNKVPISELLIEHGASLDALDRLHRKPLDIATSSGNWDAEWALCLFDRGAKAEADHFSFLIQWSAYLNRLDTVKRLVALGAPIHLKDSEGNTPYAIAKRNGSEEVAAFLFQEMTLPSTRVEAPESNMILNSIDVPNQEERTVELKERENAVDLPAPPHSAVETKNERPRGEREQEQVHQVPVEIQAQLAATHSQSSIPLSRREWTLVGIIVALLVAFLAVALR